MAQFKSQAQVAPPTMLSDSVASKLRAKIRAMPPEELQSEDGQLDQRRFKEHEAAREKWAAEHGKALRKTKLKLRVQSTLSRIAQDTSAVKETGEQTKANTDELLQRALGKIPEKRPDQTNAERKRELDQALANVPAWRAERKQMVALERQGAKEAAAEAKALKEAAVAGMPGAQGRKQKRTVPKASAGAAAEEASEALCETRRRIIERSGRQIAEITHIFREGKCPAGFKCGDEFGVRQLVGVFTEDELSSFEKQVDEMVAHDERWQANTLDISPPGATGDKKKRTKLFFPQYTYGPKQTPKRGDCAEVPLPPGQVCRQCRGAQTLITEQCNDIPDWIYHAERPCLASILVELGILENGWANSAILNMYHKRGGKLLGHFDSPHLFARPIIAVSRFSAKSLSFGVGGQGMQPQERHYTVDMPQGAVTIMYGFAANQINHAVKPVREKVASLLLRRMHPSLLGDKWVAKNTVQVNQASTPVGA